MPIIHLRNSTPNEHKHRKSHKQKSPRPKLGKFFSLILSFVLAIGAFGAGIGVVYATVTISQNIQIGSGTPDFTLDGDDLYVTGTAEVDGDLAAKTGGGATFVVAASDASARVNNQADYVADGTDDDVQIQAAIDALPAGGGKVVLSEGTFNLANGLQMTSGLLFEGQGYSTRLNLPGAGNIVNATNVNNVVIKRLRIVGNPAEAINVGVRFNTVTDSIVENVWVEDVGFDGIQLIGGNSRITVSNSFVDNAQDDGINIGGSTTPASNDIVITGNHVTNSGAVGIHNSWGASFVSIVGNTVEGTGTFGIDVNLENDGAKHTTVVGNTVRNTGSHGLAVSGSSDISDVIISENVIDSVGDSGIRISNNGATRWTVTDNLITNATTRGIIISQGSPSADRNFIIANNIVNGGVTNQGINLFNVNNALVLGNIVTEIAGINSIDMNGGSQDNHVIGNKVDGNIASANSDIVRDNMGWVTENSGTATIPSASTSVTVSHGLNVTPAAGDCSFVGAEDPTNSPGAHWIDTFTSTQMNLNVENDPGASNYDVAWTCSVY